LQDEPDGMATLYARLPAADAVGCYAVLDEYARRASGPDRPGMDARRADTLVDLICGADPGRVTVQVRVAVPAGTLLGIDDTPGELAGYGAIPADAARRIAAEGTWRRLLTDPRTGRLHEMSVATYQPPQDMADFVVARDQTCRGLGCRMPAARCDLDHRVPHPHGPTSPTSSTRKPAHSTSPPTVSARSGLKASRSSSTAMMPAPSIPRGIATQIGSPSRVTTANAK